MPSLNWGTLTTVAQATVAGDPWTVVNWQKSSLFLKNVGWQLEPDGHIGRALVLSVCLNVKYVAFLVCFKTHCNFIPFSIIACY